MLGLLPARSAERPHGDRDLRARRAPGLGEALVVALGDPYAVGVDEVRERVGEPQLGGPQRALRRGPEQPRLRRVRAPGKRAREVRERVVGRQPVLEVPEQLGELRGEIVGRRGSAVALQRERGEPVGAGRAPDRQVDALRVAGRRAG